MSWPRIFICHHIGHDILLNLVLHASIDSAPSLARALPDEECLLHSLSGAHSSLMCAGCAPSAVCAVPLYCILRGRYLRVRHEDSLLRSPALCLWVMCVCVCVVGCVRCMCVCSSFFLCVLGGGGWQEEAGRRKLGGSHLVVIWEPNTEGHLEPAVPRANFWRSRELG